MLIIAPITHSLLNTFICFYHIQSVAPSYKAISRTDPSSKIINYTLVLLATFSYRTYGYSHNIHIHTLLAFITETEVRLSTM